MTDIIFSFDTEDFTSNAAADAIYREAEILKKEGIRGGFCVVGLVAEQLKKWGRDDVIEALRHHEILSHTYSHSIHPTLHEHTDIDDFDEAYKRVFAQEKEGIRLIKETFGDVAIYGACPPGNQKNYVAMYAYADMGLPVYADTVCDTTKGRGAFYCNIYHTQYSFGLENFFGDSSDEYMLKTLDELSSHDRVILFTHPNAAMFSEFWDSVNYYKQNQCEFGKWKECKRRPVDETEKFYDSIKRFIQLIKRDKRFNITCYSDVANRIKNEGQRVIKLEDIHLIRESLKSSFSPQSSPVSCSLSDIFLACKDFLLGRNTHICGKVYGFLDTPYEPESEIAVTKQDMLLSAKEMNTSMFLPEKIKVGSAYIGPADWLFAAMDIICGEDKSVVTPKKQLPSLDIMPRLRDVRFKGGWIQSDDFEDKYISKRLRLQCWTMRFL